MKLILIATSLLFSSFSFAEGNLTKVIDLATQDSKVEFFAVGKPSMLKINGTGGKIKGQIEVMSNIVKGILKVPLADLSTGIALRDEHMKKKYLETDKFPEASLQITDFKMDKDYLKVKGSQKNIPFTGKLTVHGIEKDVTGTADLESDDKVLTILAKTNTNISNHKIDLPTYLGVKVADEVAIQTELKIKK